MADKYPEIFVLRHGETEWNRVGRHQGRMDSPLTDLGQMQAATQGEILRAQKVVERGFQVFSSPQGRARQTADIACGVLGCGHAPDARLCEIAFGEWESLTYDEIAKGWPEHTKNADIDIFDWHFNAPGGESYEVVRARAEAFLDGLTGPSVVVTHGITSRVMRGVLMGHGWNGTAGLPDGQGCVYHLREGEHSRLGA